MEPRNVICLVVDRLQAAQVGAYGNTWIHTPQLNRLAAESFLFDRALTDTLDLDRLYRGLWRARPAIWPDETVAGGPSLPALAAAAGMETVLLTDDPAIESCSEAAAGFNRPALLTSHEPDQIADQIEDTQAAHFVGAAGELLTTLRQPFFLWLHVHAGWPVRGMRRTSCANSTPMKKIPHRRISSYRPAASCRPTTIRTSCSALPTHTPARFRSGTRAWGRWSTKSAQVPRRPTRC